MEKKPPSPYREAPPQSIQEMEKEIAEEGAVGIRLPDELLFGQEIDLAEHAIHLKVNLENSLLYSPQWGILRFDDRQSFDNYYGQSWLHAKDDIIIFKNDQGAKVSFRFNRDTKKFTV